MAPNCVYTRNMPGENVLSSLVVKLARNRDDAQFSDEFPMNGNNNMVSCKFGVGGTLIIYQLRFRLNLKK